MSMIEIILSIGIKLFVAIVATILVSKLKYFKNPDKSGGKKLVILGVWIYSISSMPFLRFVKETINGVVYIGTNSIWEWISYIGLFLGIIGIVLCIIPKTTKDNTTTSKTENANKTDDINLF